MPRDHATMKIRALEDRNYRLSHIIYTKCGRNGPRCLAFDQSSMMHWVQISASHSVAITDPLDAEPLARMARGER